MALFQTFGQAPTGSDLLKIEKSPNYHNKAFQNFSPTVLMADNSSMAKNIWKFMNKPRDTSPPSPLPSVKTDLKSIAHEDPVIIWFGHSSYFIRIDGINILVDPVFSGHASPFSFGAKSFIGSDAYTTEDFPAIDLLILTHDHYDHLDSRTVLKLKPKIKRIVTSLGVGSHLAYWGFDKNLITELDWWDISNVVPHVTITAAPGRHFSGRSLVRNKTLWSSFILQCGMYKLFVGGDSGYDSHFKMIGDKFGPFDIAMLESGQYNVQWPDIHMMPEDTVKAAIELRAKVLLPVHWGKFALALHPWDEPVNRILKEAAKKQLKITTPMIGEPIVLNKNYPDKHWWDLKKIS